ncbi:MAG: hypothetical protein ACYSUK_01845 [Planctomycetota bacterium]|jgi:hypothetical protein
MKQRNQIFMEGIIMWKKIVLVSLCLVVGFVIGCILTMAYTGHTMATTMFMLQEKEIFEMEEVAVQAYYNEPNEVAVWALENCISTLNRVKEERSIPEVEDPYHILSPIYSLTICHAMLGQLYKKMGEPAKSQKNFEQAISYGRLVFLGIDFDKREEALVKLLNIIERGRDNYLK